MTFSPRKQHARGLFAGIAGDYDQWAQTLSFGQDARWHDELVAWLRLPEDATGRPTLRPVPARSPSRSPAGTAAA